MTPTITMTNFLDFVTQPGTRRWTEVKKMRQRYAQPYHPSRDYYSVPREAIVDVHARGASRDALQDVVDAARPNEQDICLRSVETLGTVRRTASAGGCPRSTG